VPLLHPGPHLDSDEEPEVKPYPVPEPDLDAEQDPDAEPDPDTELDPDVESNEVPDAAPQHCFAQLIPVSVQANIDHWSAVSMTPLTAVSCIIDTAD
jgi:hypothetical protein